MGAGSSSLGAAGHSPATPGHRLTNHRLLSRCRLPPTCKALTTEVTPARSAPAVASKSADSAPRKLPPPPGWQPCSEPPTCPTRAGAGSAGQAMTLLPGAP